MNSFRRFLIASLAAALFALCGCANFPANTPSPAPQPPPAATR
jgi:uncharacterized membrane protein YraQ (UPF0718 family)